MSGPNQDLPVKMYLVRIGVTDSKRPRGYKFDQPRQAASRDNQSEKKVEFLNRVNSVILEQGSQTPESGTLFSYHTILSVIVPNKM